MSEIGIDSAFKAFDAGIDVRSQLLFTDRSGPGRTAVIFAKVVITENKVVEVFFNGKINQPVDVILEILRFHSKQEIDIAGIFFLQSTDAFGITIKIRNTHPDALTRRIWIIPAGMVGKSELLKSLANSLTDIVLVFSKSVMTAVCVGMVIGLHDLNFLFISVLYLFKSG